VRERKRESKVNMDGFTQALGLGYRRDAVGRVVVEDGLVRMQPYGGGLHIDALKSASAALENAQAQLLGILGYSVGEVSLPLSLALSRARSLSLARARSQLYPASLSRSLCLFVSLTLSLAHSLCLCFFLSLFFARTLSCSRSLSLCRSISRFLAPSFSPVLRCTHTHSSANKHIYIFSHRSVRWSLRWGSPIDVTRSAVSLSRTV